MIPLSYCFHDLIGSYKEVALDCFLPELWPFAIITIEKPCLHNILRTTFARILIVGRWLKDHYCSHDLKMSILY